MQYTTFDLSYYHPIVEKEKLIIEQKNKLNSEWLH